MLNHHQQQVLAMAHRELDLEAIGGLSCFREWSRDQMEQDINLIGLVIFKNQLKVDTAENIAALKRGATRTVMITGDTALTGVYIARQCGMVPQGAKVLLGDYDRYQDTVVWRNVDESPEDEKPIMIDCLHGYMSDNPATSIELAMTGKAFQWMMDHDLIRHYLLDVRVFARMTPNQKVQCVQLHMERGITAMSGDGGNDCGALRAAHVGIAMSDAEASIVSPFSTSHRSVASCVELLRQGRAALVTSITGYKYLVCEYTMSFYCSNKMLMSIYSIRANHDDAQDIFVLLCYGYATIRMDRCRLFHYRALNMGRVTSQGCKGSCTTTTHCTSFGPTNISFMCWTCSHQLALPIRCLCHAIQAT